MPEPKAKIETGTMPSIGSSELLACVACKEEAGVVNFFDGGSGRRQPCYIVRPYRKSKCKHYKPGCSGICQFVSYGTADDAIAAWNAKQANSD